MLLGVSAVIAEHFESIHHSMVIGTGSFPGSSSPHFDRQVWDSPVRFPSACSVLVRWCVVAARRFVSWPPDKSCRSSPDVMRPADASTTAIGGIPPSRCPPWPSGGRPPRHVLHEPGSAWRSREEPVRSTRTPDHEKTCLGATGVGQRGPCNHECVVAAQRDTYRPTQTREPEHGLALAPGGDAAHRAVAVVGDPDGAVCSDGDPRRPSQPDVTPGPVPSPPGGSPTSVVTAPSGWMRRMALLPVSAT